MHNHICPQPTSCLIVVVIFSLLPPAKAPQNPILLFQPPYLSLQLLLALPLTLQCRPGVIRYSPQPSLPLRMLEPQLHAHASFLLQQALIVLVQCKDLRRLVICVWPQLIKQQRQRVLVVRE